MLTGKNNSKITNNIDNGILSLNNGKLGNGKELISFNYENFNIESFRNAYLSIVDYANNNGINIGNKENFLLENGCSPKPKPLIKCKKCLRFVIPSDHTCKAIKK